jgi:N-acetylglucosamine malate deacetylase 1
MFPLSINYSLKKVRRRLISVVIRFLAQPAEVTAGSVLIIAPHPDDETFACGGLIALKESIGSKVFVIFLTDGEASHQNCSDISSEEIGHVRRELAMESGRILGINSENMFWFGLPDGKIPKNGDGAFKSAVEKLAGLFFFIKPFEIYTPHFLDCWRDHEAANEIVRSALKNYAHPYNLYYYPIWMWHNLQFRLFPKLLRTKAICLDITSVINKKSAAIQHYLSKCVPGCGKPFCGHLPIKFIENFLCDYEIYFKTSDKNTD